ncbi:MAG: PIN domain-containing protein [Nanoarchaeota archaeon]
MLYFLDTCAILEIFFGNKNYEKYKDVEFITSKLNLFETHYRLLRDLGAEKANLVLLKYLKYLVEFDIQDIKEASFFRWHNKQRKLSMVDTIGYVLAKKNKALFLTGDKEFWDIQNVEFVK